MKLKLFTFSFNTKSPIEQSIAVYAERLSLAKDMVMAKLNRIGIEISRKDLKLKTSPKSDKIK